MRKLVLICACAAVIVFAIMLSRGNLKWKFEEEAHKLKPLVEELTKGCDTEVCKAKALYNFVRDEIKFGFTPEFDTASPSYTALVAKKGHCNPKASLFVTMLRVAGITARIRTVPIYLSPLLFFSKGNLKNDAMSSPGIHSFTEIKYTGSEEWIPVDGYVLDRELYASAKEYLQKETNASVGYFTVNDPRTSVEWDGVTSSMSQYVDDRILAKGHGTARAFEIEDIQSFYESGKFPFFHKLMYRLPNDIPLVPKAKELIFYELNNSVQKVRTRTL